MMRKLGRRLTFSVMLMVMANAADADEGLLAGIDGAVALPTSSFKNRAETGGGGSLFLGYMFNDYLGAAGQVQYTAFGADDTPRPNNSRAQALGIHAGPRLALPFDLGELPAELYATWQGGLYTGLVGDTPISRTSWGFSTGAGLNFRITDSLLIGPFGRYNWLDQRAEPGNNVQFVTIGIGLTYNAVAVEPVDEPAPAPQPTPAVKKKIVLRGVNFDVDKSDLRADARPVLDGAIATLKKEGGIAVIAEGHTDSTGNSEYNQALSKRRAAAVRDYLVAHGIAADRIVAQGLGEGYPVADNNTPDGRSQNRRVELKIRNGK